MTIKSFCIAAVSLAFVPGFAPSMAHANGATGCTVDEMVLDVGEIFNTAEYTRTSGVQELTIRCTEGIIPQSVTISLGGVSSGTRASLAGPNGSVIPFYIYIVGADVTLSGNVGTTSPNFMPHMRDMTLYIDPTGTGKIYRNQLNLGIELGHPETVKNGLGEYSAYNTVEIVYE